MEILTSLENERVKNYINLKKKKYRDASDYFIVEGYHLALEAFRAGLIEEVILENYRDQPFPSPYVRVSTQIMKKISTLDTHTDIVALCKKKYERPNLGNKLLILDQIQDPGNLGTMIRSASAFNIDTIVLSENTVDLYNPKVIRATQGMMFRINIVKSKCSKIIELLKETNIPVYGTKVECGINARTLSNKEKQKFALVMGNEGTGVRSEISDLCNKNLYIKLNEFVESLNVGVAASILLYELDQHE